MTAHSPQHETAEVMSAGDQQGYEDGLQLQMRAVRPPLQRRPLALAWYSSWSVAYSPGVSPSLGDRP